MAQSKPGFMQRISGMFKQEKLTATQSLHDVVVEIVEGRGDRLDEDQVFRTLKENGVDDAGLNQMVADETTRRSYVASVVAATDAKLKHAAISAQRAEFHEKDRLEMIDRKDRNIKADGEFQSLLSPLMALIMAGDEASRKLVAFHDDKRWAGVSREQRIEANMSESSAASARVDVFKNIETDFRNKQAKYESARVALRDGGKPDQIEEMTETLRVAAVLRDQAKDKYDQAKASYEAERDAATAEANKILGIAG